MSSGSRHMARRGVVQALYRWELTGELVVGAADSFLNDWGLRGVDHEYFKELVQGIPSSVEQLDDLLKQCLDRNLSSVDYIERTILRLAVYELQFCPDIPTNVVLDEAIELARAFGAEQGYRFVNAVLDRCQLLCRNPELPSE